MNPHSAPIAILHPRIGASFALIPITIGIEVLLWHFSDVFFSGFFSSAVSAYVLAVVPLIIFYGGTLLIWAPAVEWTRRKAFGTALVSFILAIAVITSIFFMDIAVVMGTALIGGGIAIGILNRIWWTPSHRRARSRAVLCPNCGYDLRAQQECRCPECGKQFTLSELVYATVAKIGNEGY